VVLLKIEIHSVSMHQQQRLNKSESMKKVAEELTVIIEENDEFEKH